MRTADYGTRSFDLSGSRLRVMDECGSSGVVGTEIVKSPDGHEYDFGIVTAPGGRYEVCWCIGIEPYVGCALNAHFGVRVTESARRLAVTTAVCKLAGTENSIFSVAYVLAVNFSLPLPPST